jgi:hypothetical protein
MFGSSRYSISTVLTNDPSGGLQKLAAPGTFLRFPSTVISQSELGLRLILSAHRAFNRLNQIGYLSGAE